MKCYEVPDRRFLSDEERERYEIALAKWQKMRETKYSDRDIKSFIDGAISAGVRNIDDTLATIAVAQAMITYNEMIDERISAAQRSWR